MASWIRQLNWMSRQGRYDLSYGVSHVQQAASKLGREALEWLNKVIYRAKQEQIQVVRKLDDWRNFVVISASDASYGGQPGGHSQGGVVVGLHFGGRGEDLHRGSGQHEDPKDCEVQHERRGEYGRHGV